MTWQPGIIDGVWKFSPTQKSGPRGRYVECYSAGTFSEAVGHDFTLGHWNVSTSRRGALHGLHYADVPPGQAKLLVCVTGSIWDVAVDVRVGSRTFTQWEAVLLDGEARNCMYLSEGLAHGYIAMTEGSTLVYACSQPYLDGREHNLDPLDEHLGVAWPKTGADGRPLEWLIGRQDRAAANLNEALLQGWLPRWRSPVDGPGV